MVILLLSSRSESIHPYSSPILDLSHRSTLLSLILSLQTFPYRHTSHAEPRHPKHTPPRIVNVHPAPNTSRNICRRARPLPTMEQRTMLLAAWAAAEDLGCKSTRSGPQSCIYVDKGVGKVPKRRRQGSRRSSAIRDDKPGLHQVPGRLLLRTWVLYNFVSIGCSRDILEIFRASWRLTRRRNRDETMELLTGLR